MSPEFPMQPWRGRLNSFQRMMLNWEDLHPYNAVHVIELPSAISPEQTEKKINTTLEGLGLTPVVFDPSGRFYDYLPPFEPPEFRVVPCPEDAESALTAEITSELNRAFPQGRHSPLRFFFLQPETGHAFLGVTYHHAVGDASSISKIMQKILLVVTSNDELEGIDGLDLFPPGLRTVFSREIGLRRAHVLLKSLGRDWLKFKGCHVPAYGDEENQEVGFAIYGMESPTSTLLDLANQCGATVQDIVFAAMLEGMSRIVPMGKRMSRWRENLALATVVDLRRHSDQMLDQALGQFLGSYSVSHKVPEEISFPQLVSDVAAQTNRVKTERSYFSHVWSFSVMARVWPFLPRVAKQKYARWLFPLMGAISNMNLSSVYAGTGVRKYIRAASTGPIFPILVDVTTVGDSYSLTAMFRKSAFSSSDVEKLMIVIRNRLKGMSPPIEKVE